MFSKKEKGFTLVEMAIVIAILGLVLGSVFSLLNPLNKNMKQAENQDKMEYIADSIANYVARTNQVPCPAPPDPDDNGHTDHEVLGMMHVDGSENPNCALADNRQGIVPFRTLGIHPDMAIDGWGNYFTYAVSPVYAMNPPNDDVHANCRTDMWVDTDSLAPEKARFCCPNIATYAPGTDIIVNNTGVAARTTSGVFDDVDDGTGTYDPDDVTSSIAYVIVSHGMNGYGHYLINSADPSDRDDSVGVTSNNEDENQDDDATFVYAPRNLDEGTDYFDDDILWRTNHDIRYEFGNDSCSIP